MMLYLTISLSSISFIQIKAMQGLAIFRDIPRDIAVFGWVLLVPFLRFGGELAVRRKRKVDERTLVI